MRALGWLMILWGALTVVSIPLLAFGIIPAPVDKGAAELASVVGLLVGVIGILIAALNTPEPKAEIISKDEKSIVRH